MAAATGAAATGFRRQCPPAVIITPHCTPAAIGPAWVDRRESGGLGRVLVRIIFILLVAIVGAAAFHVYYRGLPDTERCRWDHPLDQEAKRACKHAAAANVSGYSPEASHELDKLIDKVSK
jgi:hypothetical protein